MVYVVSRHQNIVHLDGIDVDDSKLIVMDEDGIRFDFVDVIDQGALKGMQGPVMIYKRKGAE